MAQAPFPPAPAGEAIRPREGEPPVRQATVRQPPAEQVARFFRALYRIRRVEEEIIRVYPQDKVQSPVHLSIGQEAVAVGVCEALAPGDVVFGSYRSHAMYLAKGGNLNRMIAELYGKATGCAKGKAGSMHLIDVPAGVMGASAVVATTIPQAVGYAMALSMGRALEREGPLLGPVSQSHAPGGPVAVSFFGDGAAEEGVFHESLNFAALAKLPVVFVCENNGYAIHSRQRDRQGAGDVCALAAAHGIPARRIEGMDTFDIHRQLSDAVGAIRGGRAGPYFFECPCYRWVEHVGPGKDFHTGYRSEQEARPWLEADEVRRLGGMLDDPARRDIEREVEEEIRQAFAFAEGSPFPEDHELYTDLFKEP